MEFLDIWNKRSGARIQTYAIYGEAGSRCCVLNGAAARTCQRGDELIICASQYLASPAELTTVRPRVLTFTGHNEVDQIMCYETGREADGRFTFAVRDETPTRNAEQDFDRRVVDLNAMKSELRGANWGEKRIADFLAKYIAV
jgi:Aspartate 1-decarboxylase